MYPQLKARVFISCMGHVLYPHLEARVFISCMSHVQYPQLEARVFISCMSHVQYPQLEAQVFISCMSHNVIESCVTSLTGIAEVYRVACRVYFSLREKDPGTAYYFALLCLIVMVIVQLLSALSHCCCDVCFTVVTNSLHYRQCSTVVIMVTPLPPTLCVQLLRVQTIQESYRNIGALLLQHYPITSW